jgi:hypothetical protein
VDAILKEFFACCNGVWSHKRADKELEKYRAFAEQQRERVAKRWAKVPTVSENIPTVSEGLPAVYHGNTEAGIPTENHKPITKNQEPRTIESPPAPRKRGKAAGAAGQDQVDWLAGVPADLDVPEFRQRWLEWVEYRRALKKPVKPVSLPAAFRQLAKMGVQEFLALSDRAMANGWYGFDHDKKESQKHDHRSEKRSREFAEAIEVPDLV